MKISWLKVGGRTIKTVVAVFLCLLTGITRKSDTAFYAAIVAVLCVRRTSKDSFREAFNREVATVIGGIWVCSSCCLRGMSGVSHMKCCATYIYRCFLSPSSIRGKQL